MGYLLLEQRYNERTELNNQPIPVIHDTQEYQTHKTFLIPVTEFTNLASYNSYSDILISDELYSLSDNKNFLSDELKTSLSFKPTVTFETKTEIYLLTPEQVNAKYRTIAIDGKHFWDKSFDEANYPFFYVEKTTTPAITSLPRTILIATGEIIPARAVDRIGLNKHDNYTYLFDWFSDELQSADITIGLLENSVMGNPTPCTGCMLFVGDDRVIKGLADTGFNFISTAGNHAGDAGQTAYENTINLLNLNNIQHTGTGNCSLSSCEGDNKSDLLKPAVKLVNNRTFGMIAADDVAGYYWDKDKNSTTFGTNYFSKLDKGLSPDLERLAQISEIKKKFNIDYLIIYMSWGVEYTNKATTYQQNLGKLLIENGADIVIGSHPHWVQNIEFYMDKPIIYSLGNFIFDQTHTLETRQGAVVNLFMYGDELKFIDIMPHQICGYHQTKNDQTAKYLNNEINLDQIALMREEEGCIFWQPKKLNSKQPEYTQIMQRIFEHTNITY